MSPGAMLPRAVNPPLPEKTLIAFASLTSFLLPGRCSKAAKYNTFLLDKENQRLGMKDHNSQFLSLLEIVSGDSTSLQHMQNRHFCIYKQTSAIQ